jgi:RNA polymerase nonessential primary-like sigma factor
MSNPVSPTSDLIRAYLQEVGRYPLLTASQEVELAQQIQLMLHPPVGASTEELRFIQLQGRRAKDKMVRSNLRLVINIAKKYQKRDMEILDLIQEGTIGLIRGVEKFDPARGYKLSTYCY